MILGLVHSEGFARRMISSAARRELAVLRSAIRLTHEIIQLPWSFPLSEVREVQLILLSNLANGVRALTIATERGYALQGLRQLASIYELAVAVGFIGASAERATQWQQHSDVRNSFPSSRQRKLAVQSLFEVIGADQERVVGLVKEWENRYTYFCMAKHGNPEFLRVAGIKKTTNSMTIWHGPIAGGRYSELAQLALGRAAKLLFVALLCFVSKEMETDTLITTRLLQRLHRIGQEVFEIEELPVFESAV